MKIDKIDTAIAEANRFLKIARALKQAKIKCHASYSEPWKTKTTPDQANCPREQGALRRASMDLTRTLADLRKPD